jgi:3-oxoacyl-[acyl-carrier protein] reductase
MRPRLRELHVDLRTILRSWSVFQSLASGNIVLLLLCYPPCIIDSKVDYRVADLSSLKVRAQVLKEHKQSYAAVARPFDLAETTFGGVDVLINNAGIMNLATSEECDDALFDRHIAVNLKGTFNTLREAARRLQNGGRIVNFSSSVVGLLQPTHRVYAATKAAVEAMTSILAKELRRRNISVNAIAPGPTATKFFLAGKPQEVVDYLAKLAPWERLGPPRDIADAVAFLAGPDGDWIHGQTLRANGGII